MASQLTLASVHAFTALGAVCALLAWRGAMEHDWQGCFAWLGVALVIDAIDGPFARRLDVQRRMPRFSGERLDLVIDYLTYVFVPVLALLQAGILTGPLGVFAAALILMSSLFHFADLENKSADHCFVGFPAVWNVVAFYLFAFGVTPALAMGVVFVLVVLTFVPWRWVHPLRVSAFRPVTIAFTAAWALAALWTVWHGFPAGGPAQVVLAAVACYGIGLSLVWRRPRAE